MLNPKKKYSNGIQTYNNCMDQLEKTGNCLLGGGQGGEKRACSRHKGTMTYCQFIISCGLQT